MKKLEVVRVISQTSEKILDGAHSEKKNGNSLKVGTREGEGTSPLKSNTKGLLAQFIESDLRNKSQRLVPKFQTGLNSWD